MKLERDGKIAILAAFALSAVSFLILKSSGFSASFIVNLQNYLIKSMIINTAGMGTLPAIQVVLSPLIPVFIALMFFVAALSVLVVYGYKNDDRNVGMVAGAVSAVAAVVLFPSLLGAFFAAGVLVACFFSPQFSATYAQELKKWVRFRIGSRTVSRMLFFMNLIVAFGVFVAVLSAQSSYEVSFKSEMVDSMKTIALSLPGAALVPEETLTETITSVINTSPIFDSYVRWLPISSAVGALFILEMLKNILLSAVGGAVTYIILRAKEW